MYEYAHCPKNLNIRRKPEPAVAGACRCNCNMSKLLYSKPYIEQKKSDILFKILTVSFLGRRIRFFVGTVFTVHTLTSLGQPFLLIIMEYRKVFKFIHQLNYLTIPLPRNVGGRDMNPKPFFFSCVMHRLAFPLLKSSL